MTELAIQVRYRVEGMDCASCATKIDTAVRRISGVEDVVVSVTAGTMMVKHGAATDLGLIEKRVKGLGYSVALLKGTAAPSSIDQCCDHDHNDAYGSPKTAPKEVEDMHGNDRGPATDHWWQGKKGLLTIFLPATLRAV